MLRSFLALAAGVLLVSCTGKDKDLSVTTSSAEIDVPGSPADFEKNVSNTVFFGFDKYDLSKDAKSALQNVANWLKNYSSNGVCVEGHTDRVGTAEYNLGLGSRRAESVKAYLINNGVDPAKVSTISYGKESPVNLGETADANAENRRAHVVVVGG